MMNMIVDGPCSVAMLYIQRVPWLDEHDIAIFFHCQMVPNISCWHPTLRWLRCRPCGHPGIHCGYGGGLTSHLTLNHKNHGENLLVRNVGNGGIGSLVLILWIIPHIPPFPSFRTSKHSNHRCLGEIVGKNHPEIECYGFLSMFMDIFMDVTTE